MTPHEAHSVIRKLGVYEKSCDSYLVPLDSGEVAIIPVQEIRDDPELAMLKAVGYVESDTEYMPLRRRIEFS